MFKLAAPIVLAALALAGCAEPAAPAPTPTPLAAPTPEATSNTTTPPAAGSASARAATSSASGTRASGEGPYRVVDVVDGDTFKVTTPQGQLTVRLIGVDTPETKHPNKPVQCFGREAAAETERLADGQHVTLVYDPSQDTRDRYGRALAYVKLPDGADLGQQLLTNGYATEYTYRQAYAQQDVFRQAEQDARNAQRGLWSPTTCGGSTDRPTTTPTPAKPTTSRTSTAHVTYANCDQARAAGAAPIHRGQPGYSPHLDRDGDGTACNT